MSQNATTAKQVYDVVKRNGHLPLNQQPTDAQLWLYAHLVIETGGRFEVGRTRGAASRGGRYHARSTG